MSEYIMPELRIFFTAMLTGAAVLYGYNMIVIIRMLIKHNRFVIAAEDLLYWIIAAAAVFRILYLINNGILQISFILGACAGMLICNYGLIKHLKKLVIGITIKLRKKTGKGEGTIGGKVVSKEEKKGRA